MKTKTETMSVNEWFWAALMECEDAQWAGIIRPRQRAEAVRELDRLADETVRGAL